MLLLVCILLTRTQGRHYIITDVCDSIANFSIFSSSLPFFFFFRGGGRAGGREEEGREKLGNVKISNNGRLV